MLFLPVGALGTLSHELAHLVPVWLRGLDWHLSYGSMNYSRSLADPPWFEALVTAAGPLGTIATGTLGWLWLRRTRRGMQPSTPLGPRGWTALVLTLFWGRQVINTASLLLGQLAEPFWGLEILQAHRGHGDELRLARAWGLPERSLAYASALVGLAFCADASLRLCPVGQRRALWLGAIPGGLLGIMIWFRLLGPWWLP